MSEERKYRMAPGPEGPHDAGGAWRRGEGKGAGKTALLVAKTAVAAVAAVAWGACAREAALAGHTWLFGACLAFTACSLTLGVWVWMVRWE